jgi:hypothetical protein
MELPEGRFLDYKREIPKNLQKTIAAMANTAGGIIILGIDDDNDKPKKPFAGMPAERGLVGKIEGLITSNIAPPPYVEIAECCSDDKQNVFLVIRIPPSIATPHHLNKENNAIYVRTGQSSRPEEIISPSRLAWVFNERAQAKLLRQSLLQRSETRFIRFMPKNSFTGSHIPQNGSLEVEAVLTWPEDELIAYQDIPAQYTRLIHFMAGWPSNAEIMLAPGGIVSHKLRRINVPNLTPTACDIDFVFLEIDKMGFISCKTQAGEFNKIDYFYLAHQIIRAVWFSIEWYYLVGFWGSVDINVRIRGVDSMTVECHGHKHLKAGILADADFSIFRQLVVADVRERFQPEMKSILRELAWGCNLARVDDQFIDTVYQANCLNIMHRSGTI